MLRNSGMMPMPSGSIRISSSSPPGRSVGLMQPTTPRQLVNAMESPLTSAAASLVEPHVLHPRRQREPVRGLARRAGGHIVDQYRAELAALAVARERAHVGALAAHRAHLDDHPALNDALGIEYGEIELEAVDGAG